MELRDIRDCENETYGCKKEKGIIVENMEEKVYTTPYGKIYYWTAYSGKEQRLTERVEEIRSFVDFFHQMVEHFRRQGLGTVAEGFLRVIVDLDHETVGSGCDSCHGKRLHHEADACRMARVDDDREMGLFL